MLIAGDSRGIPLEMRKRTEEYLDQVTSSLVSCETFREP